MKPSDEEWKLAVKEIVELAKEARLIDNKNIKDQRCETCRYASEFAGYNSFFCHRHAPRQIKELKYSADEQRAVWPKVEAPLRSSVP